MLTITGSLASAIGQYNPFRYRGYYYDSETGFYYLQSRYYDPTVARFLNADGIVGANGGIEGYNMFAYCNNNPISQYDESGMISASIHEEYETEYGTFTITINVTTMNGCKTQYSVILDMDALGGRIILPNGEELVFEFGRKALDFADEMLDRIRSSAFNVSTVSEDCGVGLQFVYSNEQYAVSVKTMYHPKVSIYDIDDKQSHHSMMPSPIYAYANSVSSVNTEGLDVTYGGPNGTVDKAYRYSLGGLLASDTFDLYKQCYY